MASQHRAVIKPAETFHETHPQKEQVGYIKQSVFEIMGETCIDYSVLWACGMDVSLLN